MTGEIQMLVPAPAQQFRLAGCLVSVQPYLVITELPGGAEIHGSPHSDGAYAATAEAHGYGADVARLNRCHELAHTLLAHWLGLSCSPTFRRLAGGQHEADDTTRLEECAVLAVERYANHLGVDLVDVASRSQMEAT